MNKNDITIIILLYNTPTTVLENFKSYKGYKVAILDQSNDFETKKKLKKILPNLIYYKVTNKNFGFAKGINFLVGKIKTKYFLCTQADVKISPESILRLKKVFSKKKDSIISIPNLKYKKINSLKNKKKEFKKVNSFIGAIFLCDKKKFEKIDMFDSNFFFYWEDVDFSKRVELSQQKIYLNLNIQANHYNGESSSPTLKALYIRISNFKFGEYLFSYKYKRLKTIKIIREPISNVLLFLFYSIILNKKKALEKAFNLIGIIKFYKFLLSKKLK